MAILRIRVPFRSSMCETQLLRFLIRRYRKMEANRRNHARNHDGSIRSRAASRSNHRHEAHMKEPEPSASSGQATNADATTRHRRFAPFTRTLLIIGSMFIGLTEARALNSQELPCLGDCTGEPRCVPTTGFRSQPMLHQESRTWMGNNGVVVSTRFCWETLIPVTTICYDENGNIISITVTHRSEMGSCGSWSPPLQ